MSPRHTDKLSRRQLEIANFLREGKSSKAIGEILFIDPRTVDTHVTAICNKLGVRTRLEIVMALFGSEAPNRPEWSSDRSSRTNLQPSLSSLIGREREISEVLDIVARGRLVTLTGAGGCGKSRTAIAVGESLIEAGTPEVWLVELAPLTDGALIVGAIARTLQVRIAPEESPVQALCNALKDRHLTLILDNCERVIGDVATIVEMLLAQCSNLKILTTSREPLRVAGESTYRIPPMSLPQRRPFRSLAELMEFESIRLFVERARAVNHTFELSEDTASYVQTICRRLDGLPLAIELGAGRIQSLDVMTITALLDKRFDLLTGGRRNALPHHRTMRATIEWSYDLLSAAEKTLLERTAVFANGWTLDAAATICAFGDLESHDIFDQLSSLVAKSLVVMDLASHQARYRLLDSTRDFACEMLRKSNDQELLSKRLGHWIAEFADRARVDSYTIPRKRWIPRIDVELDNVRTAFDWAIGPTGDVRLAAQILFTLQSFWMDSGQFPEAEKWLHGFEKRIDIDAMTAEAGVFWYAKTLVTSGAPCVAAGREAIARFAIVGNTERLAAAYFRLGVGIYQMGDYAEAERAIDEAIGYYRQMNLTGTLLYADCLAMKAATLLSRERRTEARHFFTSCLTLNDSLGDVDRARMQRLNVAELAFADGDVLGALEMTDAILAASERHNDTVTVVANLNGAMYALVTGHLEIARRRATDAIFAADQMRSRMWRTLAIQHLATTIVLLDNDADVAARLLGYVEGWLDRNGVAREPTDRVTLEILARECQERLDAEALLMLKAHGRQFSDQEAMALALGPLNREIAMEG